MASTSFRFMDLPKELRLDIYEYLLTRTHHEFTMSTRVQSVRITLVTSDPIPPIHLTCKSLLAEAAPLLKGKVSGMTASRATPRIILHADALNLIFVDQDLIDCMIEGFHRVLRMPGKSYETVAALVLEMAWDNNYSLTNDTLHSLVKYLLQATKCVGRWGVGASWLDDALKVRVEHEDTEDGLPDNQTVAEAQELASDLMALAKGRLEPLNILVLGNKLAIQGFTLPVLLPWLADQCENWGLKASVFSHGFGGEQVDFTDDEYYLHYVGAISDKTWKDEWA